MSSSSAATPKKSNTSENVDPKDFLSDERNQPIFQYAIMAIGAAVVIKLLVGMMSSFAILLLPLLYFYLVTNCPKESSFDVRKELKRVMRGNHLPESHPEKPKSWLEKQAARVTASVTTELATLPGYDMEMTPFFKPTPAVILTIVTVPTLGAQYYWVGAHGEWYFLFAREVQTEK
eukprot:scaffold2164_cov106-Cylindrotheca_fusiformis.AAC.8